MKKVKVEKTWESIFQDVPWVDKEFFKKEHNLRINMEGTFSKTRTSSLVKFVNKKYINVNTSGIFVR